MLCQKLYFKTNQQFISIQNVNGQQKQIDLCQKLLSNHETDPNNTILGGLGNAQTSSTQNQSTGMNPFDDFFSNLNNFHAFGGQDSNQRLQHNQVVEITAAIITIIVQTAQLANSNNKRFARRIWYQRY